MAICTFVLFLFVSYFPTDPVTLNGNHFPTDPVTLKGNQIKVAINCALAVFFVFLVCFQV